MSSLLHSAGHVGDQQSASKTRVRWNFTRTARRAAATSYILWLSRRRPLVGPIEVEAHHVDVGVLRRLRPRAAGNDVGVVGRRPLANCLPVTRACRLVRLEPQPIDRTVEVIQQRPRATRPPGTHTTNGLDGSKHIASSSRPTRSATPSCASPAAIRDRDRPRRPASTRSTRPSSMSDHDGVQDDFRLLHALADVEPDARRVRRQSKRHAPRGRQILRRRSSRRRSDTAAPVPGDAPLKNRKSMSRKPCCQVRLALLRRAPAGHSACAAPARPRDRAGMHARQQRARHTRPLETSRSRQASAASPSWRTRPGTAPRGVSRRCRVLQVRQRQICRRSWACSPPRTRGRADCADKDTATLRSEYTSVPPYARSYRSSISVNGTGSVTTGASGHRRSCAIAIADDGDRLSPLADLQRQRCTRLAGARRARSTCRSTPRPSPP